MFFWNSLAFSMIQRTLAIWSLVPLPFLKPAWTLGSSRLEAGGEGNDQGWDGWMASWTWWTWVWVNSGRWWWTGRPGMLWFMGSQRVGHDWATELNWSIYIYMKLWVYANSVPLPECLSSLFCIFYFLSSLMRTLAPYNINICIHLLNLIHKQLYN